VIFFSYDSETDNESQANSPVKSRKSRFNGNKSAGSPKKGVSNSSRKMAAPISDDEIEDERGEHHGEENGEPHRVSDINVVTFLFFKCKVLERY